MFQKPKVPDRVIQQKVATQLPRRGIRPPSDVRVSVRNGTVTLSGKIEFDMQRKAALHAATGVNGVQRVVDQMTTMHSTIGGWHSNKHSTQTTRSSAHSPPRPPEKPTARPSKEASSEASTQPETDG